MANTRVGMVRPARRPWCHGSGSPHPHGDGPKRQSGADYHMTFSPPAWGWSAADRY
jgi:hypothetical protein